MQPTTPTFWDNIDLPTVQSGFNVVKDVVTAVVAVWGLIYASRALDTWKRQLHGQEKYGLAKRILLALNRVRDEVKNVRSPLITGGESSTALKKSEAENGVAATSNGPMIVFSAVYRERWRRMTDAWSALSVEMDQASVVWHAEVFDEMKELDDLIWNLKTAVENYCFAREDPQGRYLWENSDGRAANDAIVHNMSAPGKLDPFMQQLELPIEKLRQRLIPRLGK